MASHVLAALADKVVERISRADDHGVQSIHNTVVDGWTKLQISHFVQENDHEVVADAEVRLVKLVGHVEA